jgi:hypothetical protein
MAILETDRNANDDCVTVGILRTVSTYWKYQYYLVYITGYENKY